MTSEDTLDEPLTNFLPLAQRCWIPHTRCTQWQMLMLTPLTNGVDALSTPLAN